MPESPMPLWEDFIRNRSGLPHKHCGSVHAPDATMALQAARDVYTRRGEAVSIWVVPSSAITASDPAQKDAVRAHRQQDLYRHPTFYEVPDDTGICRGQWAMETAGVAPPCGEGVRGGVFAMANEHARRRAATAPAPNAGCGVASCGS
jgi:ring-1,2-phenylacetyl-CoA epoxidase subunit PaaB